MIPTDRPLWGDSAPVVRLVLTVGCVFGIASLYTLRTDRAHMLGVNYRVYHVAAESALAGEDFYAVSPAGFADLYTFLYPPALVLPYLPLSVLSWPAGFAVQTALTVAGGLIATGLLVRAIEARGRTLGWIDVGLIAWFLLASIHAMPSLWYGNVNPLLAAGFVGGFSLLNTGGQRREAAAGALFGVVALVKVFPALVGVYLLRVRAWRAVGGAIATGLGGLVLGALAFGHEKTRSFFVDVLVPRGETDLFVGGYPPGETYYVTVQRPLSHLLWTVWPEAPAAALPVLAAAFLAVPLVICYRDVATHRGRLLAITATCVVTVVFFPAYRLYLVLLYFPLVVLLYSVRDRRVLVPLAVGTLLAGVPARPGRLVAAASGLPEPLATLGTAAATLGTTQLWGLALILGTCCFLALVERDGGRPPTA